MLNKIYRKSHSKETRKKLSEIRKKWLKENPDKHPWKSKDKFKSPPCEKLKEELKESNITFIEEFQPLKDRFFSIDIAFPDNKLGIEINGQQHYDSEGNLKEYYQERHDLIEAEGWELIEIHYSKVYDKYVVSRLISELKIGYNLKNVDYSEFEFKKAKVRKCSKCVILITRNNKSGLCKKCKDIMKPSKVKCSSCPELIPHNRRSGLCKSCYKDSIGNKVRVSCKNCSKVVYKYSKTGLCSTCFHKSRIGKNRKVDRPSKEVLEKEIESNTWVALGKKYGVSDNAVRKWAKSYKI